MNCFELKRSLKALILLLIRAHPMGLRVLIGDVAPPTDDEISLMLGTLRDIFDPEMIVDTSGTNMPEEFKGIEKAECVNKVVESAGGWAHINAACQGWAKHYRKTWSVIMAHSQYVYNSFSRIDEAQMRQIEKDSGLSKDTIWRYVQEFPGELARAVLVMPSEKWNLNSDEKCA